MTDDPTARVRAVLGQMADGWTITVALDSQYARDAAPDEAVYIWHTAEQFAADVAAALDAKDAEIARLQAEIHEIQEHVSETEAWARDFTPADIGMVPVTAIPGPADVIEWLGWVGKLADDGQLWREDDR